MLQVVKNRLKQFIPSKSTTKTKGKKGGFPSQEGASENIFERYRMKLTAEKRRQGDTKTIFGIFESAEKHREFLDEYAQRRNIRIVEDYNDLEDRYDIEEYRQLELAAFEDNDRQKANLYKLLKENHAIFATDREDKARTVIMAYPVAAVIAALAPQKIALMTYETADALWSVRSLDFLGKQEESTTDVGMSFLDKIFVFMEQEGITDLHMKRNTPYTYIITGRRFSGVEPLQERPITMTVSNAIIRGLMVKASQDPFSEKPEIRGLISEKVLSPDGLITRNYRLHIHQQAVKNKNAPSVSLRRLANVSEIEKRGLEGFGYHADAIALVRELIETYSVGSAIISGATNSGKSTLLYTMFLMMAKEYGKRIMTIENPIEIDMSEYIEQLDLKLTEDADEEHRMTQAMAAASFLSHDPDVTAWNEVRYDYEIEKFVGMSLQAHIAFTTLHANDIRSTVSRMVNSGAPMDDILASLRFVVNQKLLDRRCTTCAGTGKVNDSPCKKCRGKGIDGRLPLYEMVLYKSATEGDDLTDLDGLAAAGKIKYISKVDIINRYRKEGTCFEKDYRAVMETFSVPKEEWVPDPLVRLPDGSAA